MISERESYGEIVPEWEKEIYRTFKPLGPNEIIKLTLDPKAAAKYLRATCFLAREGIPYEIVESSLQQQREQARLDQKFAEEGEDAISVDPLERIQKRLLPEEQNISIESAAGYIKTICDNSVPISKLEKMKLRHGAFYYHRFQRNLPKIESAADLPKLSEITFVKDSSGEIIGEYSEIQTNENRQVIKRNRRKMPRRPIPIRIKQALVSIEDSNFWNFKPEGSTDFKGHKGVDFAGIIRAMTSSSSGNVQGASTIPMQLAKNLLLAEDVFREHDQGKRSVIRKLKEYILVSRIEKALTKDEILNWYLNTIDFGRGAQGIVMAAQVYFNKTLDELDDQSSPEVLSEIAFLAGLPKSPYGLDPATNYEEAVDRRDLVLKEMRSEGYITRDERNAARDLELKTIPYTSSSIKEGYAQPYMSAVEKQMKEWLSSHGQDTDLGFDITVPINHQYQKWAVESLQRGLLKYERQRGKLTVKPSEDQLPNIEERVDELLADKTNEITTQEQAYAKALSEIRRPYPDAWQFRLGVILSESRIGLDDGTSVNRQPKDRGNNRPKIVDGKKKPLEKWDVVLLQPFPKKGGGVFYRIASFTETQGAIVVIDNATGNVLATSGGFSVGAGSRYKGVSGNRAFVAKRQPGSTIKPLTYLFGLGQGLSPSEVLPNGDLVVPAVYKNKNRVCGEYKVRRRSNDNYYYTVRQGLEQSKNSLMVSAYLKSIGLNPDGGESLSSESMGIGLDYLLDFYQSFGLYLDREQICHPVLLGSYEVTPAEMGAAFSSLAHGGSYQTPKTISFVERNGKKAEPFRNSTNIDNAVLSALRQSSSGVDYNVNIFRLRTMLQGVVARGTARSIQKWSEVIAGKTGTTNGNGDAWFVGFNKEITVAVWVGNKNRKNSLGGGYDGARLALPIFEDFMEHYYEAYPEKLNDKFEGSVPGVVTARIEPSTGFLVDESFQRDYQYYTGRTGRLSTIVEYFASDYEMRSQTKRYVPGSRVAGTFFFDNLSNEYRSSYQSAYNSEVQPYRDALDESRQGCETYRYSHPNHYQVIEWCNNVKNYTEYLNNFGSLEDYYLRKVGFY